MLITFVEPIVLTQDQFYQLNPSMPSSTTRIYVGFVSDNTNIATIWSLRNWYLRDIRGVIIKKGQVNVQLNTYNSFVDLSATGLTPNTVYTFSIDNPPSTQPLPPMTTIISTISIPTLQIKVIDETFRFTGAPTTIGDLAVVPTVDGGTPAYAAQFPQGWPVMRAEGDGLVLSGGLMYAYAPTAIYTRNRAAPAYVDFTPFRGLAMRRVRVYQVPTIWSEGNFLYSVDPPTRLTVSWRESIVGATRGAPGSDVYKTYDTRVAVASVDVLLLASGGRVAGVRIVPVFG